MRHTLALLLPLLLVLGGCGASHGRAEGDDAGTVDDAAVMRRDGGPRPDAGPPSSCDPDDAAAVTCPEYLCDGPSTWHWNGESCFAIDCGACAGADCDRGTVSMADCISAHALCTPSLCQSTGGAWLWWAELCGHYECGRPPPEICETGYPGCDCGSFRRFVDGVGCVDEPECPIPEPATPAELCRATEGTWTRSLCCHTTCGAVCPALCDSDACDCGPWRVFDEGRGCIDSPLCHERRVGGACDGAVRCEAGMICCLRCSGIGCPGPAVCQTPVCDADPYTDECGNDSRIP